MPIEKKESIRWIENVKQSTDLLDDLWRCVHIGDRESDVFELFCTAKEAGTSFLVRTCVDRLAEEGNVTISEAIKKRPVQGGHRVEVRDKAGHLTQARLRIRIGRMTVRPPIGRQDR